MRPARPAAMRRVGRLVAEHWFYHLVDDAAGDVLPTLLEKTLARGWRAAVQCRDAAQLAQLDDALWTYRDAAFLPHGRSDQPHAARQPVVLSLDGARPNGAQALFMVGGAAAREPDAPRELTEENVERVVILFEDNDDEMRGWARHRWRALSQAGADVSYWRRGPDGRWRKQ